MKPGKSKQGIDRNWQKPSFTQDSNHPVVCVNTDDAEAYALWLSQKTGKRYRLPTVVEWEYAARTGSQSTRYWEEETSNVCVYANVGDQTGASQWLWDATKVHSCSDGYVYTAPVGNFRANAFGLYDMLGNVREWTCSGADVYGKKGYDINCQYSFNVMRVVRGGSWDSISELDPYGNRRRGIPGILRLDNLGFRLAEDN
jgi:formylglycine-generating enzyme required for sulfatase activity